MAEPRFLTFDSQGASDGDIVAYNATLNKLVPVTTTTIGGAGILTGTTVPGSGLGSDGAVYIRTNTGDLYKKEGSAWVLKGNLKGPPGADGSDGTGPPGPPGDPGAPGPPGADAVDRRRYNREPTEAPNGSRTVFTLPEHFVAGTSAVFRGMARLKLGPSNDYVEVTVGSDTTPSKIEFALAPPPGTPIVVDYVEAA